MKLLFKLAAKNLIGAGLRTWLNVIVLSFSFLIIIWHKGLLDGWDRQAKNETISWETGGGQYWQENYDPYDPFSLTEAHSVIPQSFDTLVSKGNIAAILITQGTIYPSGRIQSILIKGISSNQKLLKIPSSLFIKNSEEVPALIGRNTATDNRIKEGDLITLRWRDVHGTFDAGNIKVIGIFDADVPTVDMGQIWLPLDRLQKMMDMPGEATILVWNKEEQRSTIAQGWKFKTNEVLLKSITDLIKMKSVGGIVLYIILMSLAMLAIFDTQVLSIFRRQKEIGTYIALGMTRGEVVGLFTIEGSLNSVLAGLLAALYGIPLLAMQASHGMSIPGGSKGFGLAVADRIFPTYSLGLIVTTILLILLTTTIVSYLPSRKIAKMKPTEALRGKIQ
jgi:ABC-type transport system, involved in lipoprotein release, permease component